MKGHLKMSDKERKRKSVLDRVLDGEWTVVEASGRLELSYRQCRRVYKRFREDGDAGLVHRSRGRPSNRRKAEEFREAVLERYEKRYKGFGPTLASEKLCEEGYELDHETLRRWLLAEGLWGRQRKGVQHRSRRERRAHFGELVQMDGSHHRWFGETRGPCCLIDMTDDATGVALATLTEEETTEGCMITLKAWIERYGIPKALYTDRKNVFITEREPTMEEQLAGQEPLTVFGRVCRNLGIGIITAHSPQAKGRVERKHGVYQDRFCKELQLRGITTLEEANSLLHNGFTDSLNRKFAREPRSKEDYHQPVPPELNLDEAFRWEETRVVSNDWTIRYQNRVFQILKNNRLLPRPRSRVSVWRLLDGTEQVVYQGHKLHIREISPENRQRLRLKRIQAEAGHRVKSGKKKPVPSPDHPWRESWSRAVARRGSCPHIHSPDDGLLPQRAGP